MFSYEILDLDGNPCIYIKYNDMLLITQPHHHESIDFQPWTNEEDAIEWAENWILNEGPKFAEIINNPPVAKEE